MGRESFSIGDQEENNRHAYEYTQILQKHGVDSPEALAFREEHRWSDSALEERADTLDGMMRIRDDLRRLSGWSE